MRLSNEEKFHQILYNFRRFLLQLGLSTDEVKRWESTITWTVNDFGLITIQSIPFSDEILLELNHMKFKVFPSIIVWTDHIDSYVLEEPWVELLIMVKPEVQTSFDFNSECEKVFFNIMSMFSKIFQETGVYVTNEMQDGEAFLGLVSRKEEKFWEFDYAIIPSHHNRLYQNIPLDFRKYTVSNGIGYARKTV